MPSPLSASPTTTPGSQSQPQRQQSGDSYLLQQQQQQLQQQRRTPSPLPPYLQQYYNNSQLQDAISTNERAQSVPPAEMRSPSALNHRASPIDTTAAGLAKRRTTVHLDDAMTKRLMSPHITSATPTSASVRHSALYHNNPAFQHDRQSSLPGLGSTSPTSPAFAGTSAISKRDSIHSPLSTGPMNAPWLHEQGRFVGQVSGLSDDDDDEAGKGHGGRISVPPSRPDSKPLFPLAHSPQPMAGSSVVVPTLLAPSAPLTTTGLSPVKYGPLSAESSGQPTTSPIIVPQARRGAMNLKKESKMRVGPNGERKSRKRSKARRRARRAAAAAAAAGGPHDAALSLADVAERNHRRMNSNETTHSSQSGRYGPYYTSHHRRTHTNEAASYPLSHRPALSSMRSIATILLFSTMSALLHPRTTCTRIGRWAVRTCREIDDSFRDPRTRERVWKPEWLDAYVPFLIWLGVSLASTGTVIVFHTKVFTALDELSQTLQRLGLGGRFVMGGLIFLTTFPPMPLYSTLIVLCGFSFGMIEGFIISYIAALSGAITVFILSRTMLKGWMTGLLNKSGGLKKVVRAIEKQPKLLFLIRLAPYPYNLMNTLLASSPTLTFKTYTMCTALALPKLLVHTGLGTSIKNFAAYHGAEKGDGSGSGTQQEESEEEKARSATAEKVKRIAGLVGVLLCIGIFLYLMHVARKAVDNLDDEDGEGEKVEGSGSRRASAVASSSSRRHARRGTRSSASSSFSVRGGGPVEAERQRLYPGAGVDFDDEDDDEDEDEDLVELDHGGDSPYSDDSDFYSDEDDFSYSDEDDDEDNLPALDGGRAAGDDSFAGSSSSSRHHQQRPTYGRTHTADAEIDMREVGYDRRGGGGGLGSAGPSGQSPGGIVDRFKAGLGLGGNASGPSSKTRYAPLPHSDGQGGGGSGGISQPTSGAVQLSVVSSISTPMSSLPVSLANGSVQGGRRAVVLPGGSSGAGVLGARPRVSGLGERSGFMPTPPPASPSASAGPTSTRPASASAITSMGPPPPPPPAAGGVVGTNRTRAFPLPRLGPDGIPVGPAAGGYGGPSMLGTIVGTPGVGPSSSSAGGGPSLAPSFMTTTSNNTLSATTSSSASGTPDGDMSGLVDGEGGGGMGMSMEDRIAEMEKSAEEYFSSGRRWTQSSTSTGGPATAAAAAAAAGPGEGPAAKVAAVGVEEAAPTADDDLVEMQRLAQQQRRGGPRSASEMGVEEARYGN